MTKEQAWNELKQFLVENRDKARRSGGKYNRAGGTLDRVLEKMQELDPTITNEEIYFEGKEFHPSNYDLAPKESK